MAMFRRLLRYIRNVLKLLGTILILGLFALYLQWEGAKNPFNDCSFFDFDFDQSDITESDQQNTLIRLGNVFVFYGSSVEISTEYAQSKLEKNSTQVWQLNKIVVCFSSEKSSDGLE